MNRQTVGYSGGKSERHTGAGRPFGFSGRKSHLETYTYRDKLEDRRLQGLL